MPESRKRPGHHEYKAPADIPPGQRVRGRAIWALLTAILALLTAWFAVGEDYVVLAAAGIGGAVIGYFVGRAMEKA